MYSLLEHMVLADFLEKILSVPYALEKVGAVYRPLKILVLEALYPIPFIPCRFLARLLKCEGGESAPPRAINGFSMPIVIGLSFFSQLFSSMPKRHELREMP